MIAHACYLYIYIYIYMCVCVFLILLFDWCAISFKKIKRWGRHKKFKNLIIKKKHSQTEKLNK